MRVKLMQANGLNSDASKSDRELNRMLKRCSKKRISGWLRIYKPNLNAGLTHRLLFFHQHIALPNLRFRSEYPWVSTDRAAHAPDCRLILAHFEACIRVGTFQYKHHNKKPQHAAGASVMVP